MKRKTYQRVYLLIVVTAIIISAAQVYFTYQNYQVNKQRFINDVQIALDLSVEKYFADKARNFIVFKMDFMDSTYNGKKIQAIASSSKVPSDNSFSFSIDTNSHVISHVWSNRHDSLIRDSIIQSINTKNIQKIEVIKERDSALVNNFQNLTNKVMLSINEDLFDLGQLLSDVTEELERKNLSLEFALHQESPNGKTTIGISKDSFLKTTAKSSYLSDEESLTMYFENATITILLKGLSDLIISIVLIGWVIGTMIFMYRTINKQKEIAEIKDDLIGNITHEFKTPIATIYTALEAITKFNTDNDPIKNERYLKISDQQLGKLNKMVEKLLETASLDQGKLNLQLETIHPVDWTNRIVERHQLLASSKSINTQFEPFDEPIEIDAFHLENAIANLIDNALKYGGSEINVRYMKKQNLSIWEVEDNGGNIAKKDQERIFEKLYRIPTGNQHDVKGFGIGLFYAKSIAQLHGGSLELQVKEGCTKFTLKI